MRDPDSAVWDSMFSHLRKNQPALCRQWFEEITPAGVQDGRLYLRVATQVQRDYLKKQCSQEFMGAAQSATGLLLTVSFLAPGEDPVHPEVGTNSKAAKRNKSKPKNSSHPATLPCQSNTSKNQTPPRLDTQAFNPDYEFETFVQGPGNRMAHAASIAIAENPGKSYNPMFIHGGVGLGKTHLLQAICLHIKRERPDYIIHYLTCESFVTHFIESIQAGEMASFRHHFRDADMLVIDDIHLIANRERIQEEFFHTFNTLYPDRQIILSSDAPPEDIPNLEDRLVSRFQWGLVTNIEPPCFETRVAILKTKSMIRGLDMPDDVACYIAERRDSSIRLLEGAITSLQCLAMMDDLPFTLELAKEALGEEPESVPIALTVQTIIDTVSDFYTIKPSELLSKRRTRSVALPRQVCMYLSRQHTRHSLEEIGVYHGNRDHTTVMHAIGKVETLREQDNEFDRVVRTIEATLLP